MDVSAKVSTIIFCTLKRIEHKLRGLLNLLPLTKVLTKKDKEGKYIERNKFFINLHGKGAFNTLLPGRGFSMEGIQMDVKVEHELITELDMGGRKCNDDPNYQYDLCRHEAIFNVSFARIINRVTG